MLAKRMHSNEVDTDAALVSQLLSEQFPQWAGLPIRPVRSAGTDNALYRLGDDVVARLPRIEGAARQIDKERRWFPTLASQAGAARRPGRKMWRGVRGSERQDRT